MDLPRRGRLGHEMPAWVSEQELYFITICCQPRGLNQLCHQATGRAVLSTVAFYDLHLRWHCRLFLLMPDHAHGILSFPREPGIKQTVTAWKAYTRRFHSIVWQRDFFDHRLRDRQQWEEKTSYILQNPVRSGLCVQPEDWPYVYRPDDGLAR